MTYQELVERDRTGLNYGIYFRGKDGQTVCIATFNGKTDRDNCLASIQVFDMYFPGDVGMTE